ncbi:hypothetical protein [Alkalilimnicola ehrlichii]|uniref:hypothetical protein n=1 Tax=Alkalilimnicola ehrlichii TaxID=351052 RepID=UPI002161B4DA|nr:hypothetical protein [Alkalilimnicola ehrlichii]
MRQSEDKEAADPKLNLSLPPVESLAADVKREGSADSFEADPDLIAIADAFVRQVLSSGNGEGAEQQRQAVDRMGADVQQQAAHRSAMLQTPIRNLAHQGDDGGRWLRLCWSSGARWRILTLIGVISR